MRVAIIGAGVAGLTTGKALRRAGHQVEIFDRTPDVGGVWSQTRRYPGLTTQSPSAQYSFSDFPMPKGFPEWPTGAQVQRYLADYATDAGLEEALRLRTTVTAARPLGEGRWAVDTVDADGVDRTEDFDGLVVANGVFSEPAVPQYPGADEFLAAGGRVLAATQLQDAETARGKHVLVVGYGKTACDVAVPVSAVAASTDVIARQLLWKVPRKIAGVVNFKMLLLTRMGEALFRYIRLRGFEKFLHGVGRPDSAEHAQFHRIGLGAAIQAGRERAGPARPHGGHRQGRHRPGHGRFLRGRRGRPHRRASGHHDRAAPRP